MENNGQQIISKFALSSREHVIIIFSGQNCYTFIPPLFYLLNAGVYLKWHPRATVFYCCHVQYKQAEVAVEKCFHHGVLLSDLCVKKALVSFERPLFMAAFRWPLY